MAGNIRVLSYWLSGRIFTPKGIYACEYEGIPTCWWRLMDCFSRDKRPVEILVE